MCNDFRNRIPLDAYRDAFPGLQLPGGAPNLEPRDDVRITETAPIVRATADGGRELVQLRWSWPGPGGRPVYNFRSDGRRFATGRCLVPADGFYEFTDPEPPAPKRAKKTKWLFTLAGQPWFCLAGLWRPGAAGQPDAFALLTTEPGPDVAPYHARQVVVLEPEAWSAWLDGPEPEAVLQPSPAGALEVSRAG